MRRRAVVASGPMIGKRTWPERRADSTGSTAISPAALRRRRATLWTLHGARGKRFAGRRKLSSVSSFEPLLFKAFALIESLSLAFPFAGFLSLGHGFEKGRVARHDAAGTGFLYRGRTGRARYAAQSLPGPVTKVLGEGEKGEDLPEKVPLPPILSINTNQNQLHDIAEAAGAVSFTRASVSSATRARSRSTISAGRG